ncbi:bifunctional enoyl-CoA hydratase/phosphate acetyltransferase [Aliiroseovarius sediminis]|uniref:bifunctional enoyl-CoA hydratase/phosphate acetyltransferase n=1 Tax=Aliiroseovarius sediminis TaxID=2925839 RepID=UPI001F560C01|nr:bifunctional enoyl-CoA hydratase/phosphate acetyltransferase [Aliiroseovarius sediminis]MCI2393893.1 bifunctional enoyl-CoA hydratase/phosphate acetyltransferase [Aliiroseovarius sediminis]
MKVMEDGAGQVTDRPTEKPTEQSHESWRPDRLERLEQLARDLGPVKVAVVCPEDGPSLTGALESQARGLIKAILVGDEAKIRHAADEAGLDLGDTPIIAAATPKKAAKRAVEMAVAGKVDGLKKGALKTNILMGAVISEKAMRTERRMSHVFAIDVESYARLLFVSDAAINIRPDLTTLRDITSNAIDLTHALGIARPKVALLSASENINEDIESTIFAAAICKMADRGTIVGADVDGPLAMDLAISPKAAAIKGIVSNVAGQADILIVPDLVSGNILVKDLDHLAYAETAGIVMGAKVPIALTSRADTVAQRCASAALVRLVAAAQRPAESEA